MKALSAFVLALALALMLLGGLMAARAGAQEPTHRQNLCRDPVQLTNEAFRKECFTLESAWIHLALSKRRPATMFDPVFEQPQFCYAPGALQPYCESLATMKRDAWFRMSPAKKRQL